MEMQTMPFTSTISTAIDESIRSCGLDPITNVEQAYDGCNTMTGKMGHQSRAVIFTLYQQST